ncbi:hypothetical protein QL285_009747 [Trifolium repens]|nr:hypothetical protein QL285_009747 [Trifolium repens]
MGNKFNNLIGSGCAQKISLKTSEPSSLLLFQLAYFALSNHCTKCCISVLEPLSSFCSMLLFQYICLASTTDLGFCSFIDKMMCLGAT